MGHLLLNILSCFVAQNAGLLWMLASVLQIFHRPGRIRRLNYNQKTAIAGDDDLDTKIMHILSIDPTSRNTKTEVVILEVCDWLKKGSDLW